MNRFLLILLCLVTVTLFVTRPKHKRGPVVQCFTERGINK